MDPEITKKLADLDDKITKVYVSVEKTRKYFLVTMWITIIVFVIPVLGLIYAIPAFISTYSTMLSI